jgi:hypothetical protein
MKNILFLLLLNVISVYSQDKEPSPWQFHWGHNYNTPSKFEPDSIKQTSFYTGFQYAHTFNNGFQPKK